MDFLTSSSSILLIILISNSVNSIILKNKVEKKTLDLVEIIGLLPGIPLIWLIFYRPEQESSTNNFFEFLFNYLPMIFTVVIILILGFKIFNFAKK